jgi:diadenylate cyclase
MSENSDAIVIAVSEETGTISVAENGELKRGFTRDSLKKYLRNALMPEKQSKQPKQSKQSKSGKAGKSSKSGNTSEKQSFFKHKGG